MSSAAPRHRFTYDFSLWYCPEDEDVASRIAARLKGEGFRGYVEHQDQVAGTSRMLTAVEVIAASQVAILLFSAKSLGDPWCQRVCQWNLCHHLQCRGTRLIPVCLGVEKAQVPPFLQHLKELHYQAEFFFERLLKSLRTSRAAAAAAASRAGPAPSSAARS